MINISMLVMVEVVLVLGQPTSSTRIFLTDMHGGGFRPSQSHLIASTVF